MVLPYGLSHVLRRLPLSSFVRVSMAEEWPLAFCATCSVTRIDRSSLKLSARRFAALKELAAYIAPKRKAIEISSGQNQVAKLIDRSDAML